MIRTRRQQRRRKEEEEGERKAQPHQKQIPPPRDLHACQQNLGNKLCRQVRQQTTQVARQMHHVHQVVLTELLLQRLQTQRCTRPSGQRPIRQTGQYEDMDEVMPRKLNDWVGA